MIRFLSFIHFFPLLLEGVGAVFSYLICNREKLTTGP